MMDREGKYRGRGHEKEGSNGSSENATYVTNQIKKEDRPKKKIKTERKISR